MLACTESFFANIASRRWRTSVYLEALPPCPKQVSRGRLRVMGLHHTRDDVLVNFGHHYQTGDPALIDAMIATLDAEKAAISEWAIDKIKLRMQKKAISLNMMWRGRRISKFQDIGASWKADSSEENAKKLYWVMYGDYEGKRAGWSREMESDYMASSNLQYIADQEDASIREPRGCYERLITKVKTTQVKLLNRTKRKILMSRPTNTRSTDDKSRRKKGDFFIFDEDSVSHGGGRLYLTSTISTAGPHQLASFLLCKPTQQTYTRRSSVDVDLVTTKWEKSQSVSLEETMWDG